MTQLIDFIIAREEVKQSPISDKDKAKLLEQIRKDYEADRARREKEDDEFVVQKMRQMKVKYPKQGIAQ